VAPVDLRRRLMSIADFVHAAAQRNTTFTLRPFRIITLAARRREERI
jgi:hypothetical protein